MVRLLPGSKQSRSHPAARLTRGGRGTKRMHVRIERLNRRPVRHRRGLPGRQDRRTIAGGKHAVEHRVHPLTKVTGVRDHLSRSRSLETIRMRKAANWKEAVAEMEQRDKRATV